MSDEKKSINYKIQGLRAFFALNVIIWHIHWCIDPYTTRSLAVFFRGDLANVFFFFLSGYLLGRNYHLNDGFGKNWIYFLRRLISHLIHRGIYLLWIITTTFVAVASVFFSKYEGKINADFFIDILKTYAVHVCLLQSIIPGYHNATSLNGPGWFLSALVFLWAVSPLIAKMRGGLKVNNYLIISIFISILLVINYRLLKRISFYQGQFVFDGIYNAYPLTAYVIGYFTTFLGQSLFLWDLTHDPTNVYAGRHPCLNPEGMLDSI